MSTADEVIAAWLAQPPSAWDLPRGSLEPWDRVIARHRVAPWLYQHGRYRLEQLSPRLAGEVRTLAIAELARTRMDEWVRLEVFRALLERGVRFMPLKGSVLGPWLYGDPWLRPSYDIDVLIHPASQSLAKRVLSQLGFVALARRSHYLERMSHEHAFVRGNDPLVELHEHVTQPQRFPLPLEELWARAKPWQWAGLPLLRLGDADQLLSLVLHAAHHQFRIPLTHWLDFRLLYERGLTCESILPIAQRAGALGPLWCVATALAKWTGTSQPQWFISGLRRTILSPLASVTARQADGMQARWQAYWLMDAAYQRLYFSAEYAARYLMGWRNQRSRPLRS